MKKIITLSILLSIVGVLFFSPVAANAKTCEEVYAEGQRNNLYGLRSIACKVGLMMPWEESAKEQTFKDMVIKLIRLAISFVGLFAVAMIIYSGFYWMSAAGSEERVKKAQKILLMACLGVIVTTSAWIILSFVVKTTQEILEKKL